MNNQFEIELLEELRTEATHLATDTKLITDAPLDNQGLGRTFAPTDLLAVSVGSCMVTTLGIAADQFGVKLGKTITFHDNIPEKHRRNLELSALNCPAHKSLSDDVEKIERFIYASD